MAILALLLISILLAYGKAYNAILALGQTPPFGLIPLALLSALFGVAIYYLLGQAKNHAKTLENEVDALKTALSNSLKPQTKEQAAGESTAKVDIEQAVAQVIPTADTGDMERFGELMLANIAKQFDIVQGLLYQKNAESGIFSFTAGYAYFSETAPVSYAEGETLPGQVAKNRKLLNLDKVPDGYITVLSGLGKGHPKHLLIVPIVSGANETTGIIELASFKPFGPRQEELFSALGRKLGGLLFNKPK